MGFKTVTHSSKPKNFAPLILVVEEDDDTRLMLKYLLEIWKYRVIEAADLEEAMSQADKCQPNLILLCVKLQRTNKLTNSRRIRELTLLARSETILITDRADETIRASALAEGISDFLIKPIDFGELERILDQRLRSNIRILKPLFKEAV